MLVRVKKMKEKAKQRAEGQRQTKGGGAWGVKGKLTTKIGLLFFFLVAFCVWEKVRKLLSFGMVR